MENPKTVGSDPAFAANGRYHQEGLNKREEFAKAAMQGMISNSNTYIEGKPTQRHIADMNTQIAERSVEQADALIEELNK